MAATVDALAERLERVEREVSEMRRDLREFLAAQAETRAWSRLAESTFARDWDNPLDAAYDHWGEAHGAG